MDLSTRYLGLTLSHPLMPGASPMVDDLDTVKRLEDAGASAIVMHSLFEEQIRREEVSAFVHTESHEQSFAEALSYFPASDAFALGPQEYLEQLRRIKAAVSVPVIASLNGYTLGGWLNYARLMQDAGADALELNVYQLATHPDEGGHAVEERTIEDGVGRGTAYEQAPSAADPAPVMAKERSDYLDIPAFLRRQAD